METESKWVSMEPEIWKYENKGDELEGVLVAKIPEGGKYGNESYVVENRAGRFTVFATTVLKRLMKTVSIGDEIRIVFTGTKETDKDEDLKLFSIFRKREAVGEQSEGEGEIPSSSGGGENE